MPASFSISPNDLAVLLLHHRAFQAAVAVLASRRLGTTAPPQGIPRSQGGVTVNAKWICINRNSVAEAYWRDRRPTREETAVAWAIEEAVRVLRRDGAEALRQHLPANDKDLCAPLRSLFNLSWEGKAREAQPGAAIAALAEDTEDLLRNYPDLE